MLVYGVYRSRDHKRFKINIGMWGQIERAVRSAAKRSEDLHDFLEKLKPKLHCETVQPRWMSVAADNVVTMLRDAESGELTEVENLGRRTFWTVTLERADHALTLDRLYRRTGLIIELVRDRLEREKPLEVKGILKEEEEGDYDATQQPAAG